MINKKIGIIGCGNMGEAILKGLSSVIEKSTMLMVSEFDARRRDEIQSKYKMIVEIENNYVVKYSDVLILAVKPKDFDALLDDIRGAVTKDKLVISIAAGVTTKYIEEKVGEEARVVRVMPNMPASIGKGISSISAGRYAEKKDVALAKEIFSLVGDTVDVDEKFVDAVTAISGSGPAYIFYFIEALVEAGVSIGLDKETAKRLALKTASGSAELLLAGKEEPQALRAKVTSKGGTTEAAVKVFDSKKLKDIVREAVKAASDRSKELSKG